MESQLVVPRFVLDELQTLADSSDHLRKPRRRGLDVLGKLRNIKRADVAIYEATHETEADKDVDQKLLSLAKELNAGPVQRLQPWEGRPTPGRGHPQHQ